MNIDVEQTRAIAEHLRSQSGDVIITTHMQPDADAIGSACAMKGVLRSVGIEARVINESPTPANLQFLPWADTIELYDEHVHADHIASASTILCLDFNDRRRSGRMAVALQAKTHGMIMIDHHMDPEPFYDLAFHDIHATSTAELVYRFAVAHMPHALGRDVATNIYAGVMSDTGSFRFPRVTAATHRMVAHLLECGANPVEIYDTMNNVWTLQRTRLLGAVLASMRMYADGQLCTLQVDDHTIRDLGCSIDDVEGMVHYALSIAGVRCGVLIAERPNGDIKISLRSKGDFTVNRIAESFGGGGHIYAAGARIASSSVLQVHDAVVLEVEKYLGKVNR